MSTSFININNTFNGISVSPLPCNKLQIKLIVATKNELSNKVFGQLKLKKKCF